MRLSHSKLNLLLGNPMEYFLCYKMGITPKVEKKALSIGSAVHWGIENNTEDLSSYFGSNFNYDRDSLMAEAMVHGYFYHKEQIFNELLTKKDGTKLELLQETHELFIDGKLKSFINNDPHIFVGIIDLLLLTNEGFIVVDYKTSTNIPNWDDYLEQLYRYIFLLKSEFPELPVIKIAIINLRKTRSRQLRGESDISFLRRLKKDYEINDDSFVNWHIFDPSDIDEKFMSLYIDNLSRMADTGQLIDTNNAWFINYASTNSYGGSVYKDIIYHTPDCYVLYNIKDEIWDKYENELKQIRDCKPIDMKIIDENNVLNKYEIFEKELNKLLTDDANKVVINNFIINKEELFKILKQNYVCDDDLLEMYFDTYLYKNSLSN